MYNYLKYMTEENISQEFRLKNIDEARNYPIKKMNQNELMSKKHKTICANLNYIKHFLILASTITGCASLVAIPIGITSSAIGLKNCTTTAAIKKYKSIVMKKRKRSMIK